MTTSLSRGISTEMFFRLWTRAPCTATLVRAAAPVRPFELEWFLGIGAGVEKGELLHVGGAALGQANRGGGLGDQPATGQVFTGGHDVADTVVTREMRFDFAAGADLSGIPQVVEHQREQGRR